MRRRSTLACCLAWGLLGCVEPPQPPAPSFEWSGEWIDVHGYDVLPEDTCAGTLDYLDAYAGALSREFGFNEHLGLYRWYAPETFAVHDPCGRDVLGCAGLNGVFTKLMPLEHEVAHIANYTAEYCPRMLSEGLAEYYGTTSSTPSSRNIGPLLADPSATPNYPLAGAFTAFLVESYGLVAVLEVCASAGVTPDAPTLAAAFESQLGVTTSELEAAFADYDCEYEDYRSKLYECELEPATMLGPENLGDNALVLELNLDCADPRTVGPRDEVIWTLERLDVTADDHYLILIDAEPEVPIGVLEFSECAGCLTAPRRRIYDLSLGITETVVDIIELRAGSHSVRLSAQAGTSSAVEVSLKASP